MFICTKCGKKHLTHKGRTWPMYSLGPCEICGTVDRCHDVNSDWGWAFKPVKHKNKKGQNK